MGWTTPLNPAPGRVISVADWNTYISGNDSYLLNRPGTNIVRNNGGAYTTTSTSFVDIDSTNLSITLAMSGAAAQISLTVVAGANVQFFLDLTIDGVRYAAGFGTGVGGSMNTAGMISSMVSTSVRVQIGAGTHTFRPQWRVASGTGNIDAANSPICFSVQEVA